MSASPTTSIPTGTWAVDPVHSKVAFAVRHMGIATVRGEFTEFEGSFTVGEDLAGASASGTVQVQSIDTSQAGRDDDLRSGNFFDAAQFPQISFQSTKIEAVGGSELRVTGNLTLHGVTNEIVLRADVQGTDTDPWGNERVGLEVTGQLSRGEYGMKLTQALGSGNLVVADTVKIVLDISAVKQA